MASIIWVASFPRSGNTWVRFLLADLLYGAAVTSAEVERRIPDIGRGVAAEHLYGRRRTLIKTHWKYHAGLPLREDTVGVIYIVRNPLDVMVSALNYARLQGRDFPGNTANEALGEATNLWIADYVARGSTRMWSKLGYGSWEDNLDSWTSRAVPFPRIVVRYEDLRAESEAALARICRFLGLSPETKRIAEAVERCSFASMRAMEEHEMSEQLPGTFYLDNRLPAYNQGLRFMNRGGVNTAVSSLTLEQREAATLRWGAAMKRLGYA